MSHGGKDYLCSSGSCFDMYEIKEGNFAKSTGYISKFLVNVGNWHSKLLYKELDDTTLNG